MSGKKFDSNKPDLSLIPRIALEEMAHAFMLGEKKYGRYNYCGGMDASRLVAAAMRHLTSWFDGENNDQESGRSHMGHALACCAMLLRMQELGTLKDNRFQAQLEHSESIERADEQFTDLVLDDGAIDIAVQQYYSASKERQQ